MRTITRAQLSTCFSGLSTESASACARVRGALNAVRQCVGLFQLLAGVARVIGFYGTAQSYGEAGADGGARAQLLTSAITPKRLSVGHGKNCSVTAPESSRREQGRCGDEQ